MRPLRHHAITELAESGASEQANHHVDQRTHFPEDLERYSHVRVAAKRAAVAMLSQSHVTVTSQTACEAAADSSQAIEGVGGRRGIRTPDLLVANGSLVVQYVHVVQ